MRRREYQSELDKVRVGDLVISYDFPYVTDCYAKGIVEKIAEWEHCGCGGDHFHIRVIEDVWINEIVEGCDARKWVFPAKDGVNKTSIKICRGEDL